MRVQLASPSPASSVRQRLGAADHAEERQDERNGGGLSQVKARTELGQVLVLAVAHAHRSPTYWHSRIRLI